MHSIYQRFSNISALLSTCMLTLLGAISLTSLFFSADPKGTLAISSINVHPGRNQHFHSLNQEFSFIRFNVSAGEPSSVACSLYDRLMSTPDLSPLFNWNTKQLFLYLSAEFVSANGTQNEVVIWDRIVRRKEDAVINVTSKSKYVLRDMAKTFECVVLFVKSRDTGLIRFRNVSPANYTLKYNMMPYVGLLAFGDAARTDEPVPFPATQKRVS